VSVADLLAKVDGRTVMLETGEATLDLADAEIERVPPDWRDELLSILTDPNIAFIFMMLGVYGLIFELANPGAVVPGVLGAIFLMLGLYALNVLPVNYAGLALLGLGIAFMTAEAFVPSFGALGLGGLAAFALGATILFDTGSPAFALSYWTIAAVTAVTGAVLVLLIGYMVKSHRRPVTTGEQTHLGETARVDSWSHGRGRVLLHGELWNATGPARLRKGQTVRVQAIDGLELKVAPAGPPAPEDTAGEHG
jgi:membrane-bound serine protease (ClpP class)